MTTSPFQFPPHQRNLWLLYSIARSGLIATWWRSEAHGYTHDLRDAGLFHENEARSYVKRGSLGRSPTTKMVRAGLANGPGGFRVTPMGIAKPEDVLEAVKADEEAFDLGAREADGMAAKRAVGETWQQVEQEAVSRREAAL